MRYFVFLFVLIFSNSFAQKLRLFYGVSTYIEQEFSNSKFYSAEGGLEVKIIDYVKPDVEVSFMFGSLGTNYGYDDKTYIKSTFTRRVSSLNFSFCPKIFLGKEDSVLGAICILPKYSISNIEANGFYFEKNETDSSKFIDEEQVLKQTLHSLGFGIGIKFELSDNSPNSFFLNLYYNRINLGGALTALNHNTSYYNTDGNVGIGLKYYIGIKKKS